MAIELATAEPAEPENLRGVDATLAIRLGDAHAIAQESARNRVDERSEEKDPRRAKSRNSPRRFGSIRSVSSAKPVTWPPGRLKLSTRPVVSAEYDDTIGMVEVARFAARAKGGPPNALITFTRRLTRSVARVGRRRRRSASKFRRCYSPAPTG